MIPSDLRFDIHSTPPQWSNNEDQTIEKGTHVRLKIRAVKENMGKLNAIGSINEDFLG
jgi:DNA-directed RNA polymerase II subunit RPB7